MLRELLAEVDTLAVRGPAEREIGGLALDSRRVMPGDAFFALPGVHADGARFTAAAVRAGAAAVFGGPDLETGAATYVEVAEPRLALAQAATRYHAHPARALRLVAVTGTNGKTTTTYLVEAIVEAAGLTAGVIGTTGVRIAGRERPATFTTPEAPELQSLLAEMRGAGIACHRLVLELEALLLQVSDMRLAVGGRRSGEDHVDRIGRTAVGGDVFADARLHGVGKQRHATAEALDGIADGETVKLVLGDTDSLKSVVEEVKARGLKPRFQQEDSRYVLIITK